MSFSIFCLNARGLRNNIKRKALFLCAKQLKTDFVFFQESHSLAKDSNFWKSQWGNDIWLSHGSEHSAGVSCLKKIVLEVTFCVPTVTLMVTLFVWL